MSLLRDSRLWLALLVCSLAVPPASAKQPNIVLIMSDDMGFSDLGCYGGEIDTPNLDRLAAEGLRFTQFYNTSRCCPTRASLLTGLYPHQAGIGHMAWDDKGYPGYQGDLNKSCRTLAEVLKPAGYRTYAVGKWHVTKFITPEGPKDNWPTHRGFDRYYGTIRGSGSYFDPSCLTKDDTTISAFADPDYKPETYYYTNAIGDHAVRFLSDHEKGHDGQPFFLYVAFTAAHWPMHALPEDIAKYKGKYDKGYAPIRAARFKKAAEMGLIDPDQGLSEQAGDWSKVKHKKWEAACMEVYAAMIDRLDQNVGKIVAQLEKSGEIDNTLILFLQDNGGCAEDTGRKGTKKHPNIRRPDHPTLPPMRPTDLANSGSVPDQTRDGYPVRMGPNAMPGTADTFIAYGEGWANVSNTPFREYKHWVHEGGISTPLIVHWPSEISDTGELRTQPGHLIDIATTLYDIAGAQYPSNATPLEGKSLVPVFQGQPIERDAIYWEHEGNRAVRKDKWKLVAKHNQPWELYDISRDRTEQHDLSAKHPDLVKSLKAKYEAFAKRANVLPWPVEPKK